MTRVRIAIDPRLRERYGPEVAWSWRLLLSGMGLSWEEVPAGDADCDIAYVAGGARADRARFCVRANLAGWEARTRLRFASLCERDGASHPLYDGEPSCSAHFHLVEGRLICERDLVLDLFWLASGEEERNRPRNRHGHLDLGDTAFLRAGVLRRALASSIAVALEEKTIGLGLAPALPRWPAGKQAAVCAGHDVDYPEVVRWLEPARIVRRRGPAKWAATTAVLTGRRHHWHFESWIDLERSLGVHSAFYFVARQGSLLGYAAGTPDPFYDVGSARFRRLFAVLGDAGCEIGLHASYRAGESRDVLAAEKESLERACGRRVTGNRHHYWRLDPREPEATLLLHESVGFAYDSSLVHERYVGWRRGLCWPYFPFHPAQRRELGTLQMSVAWMDDQLFGHARDNPGDRATILRKLAEETERQGGCLVVDVHDYVFDAALFPGWADAYRSLLEYVLSRSGFWVATPAEVADWWIRRHASIVAASQGLSAE